jgi:virulence-associated protein VapD
MYAVAFDLVVAETRRHHPKGDPSAAYREIYETLVSRHGFEWKQGSLYVLADDDMARLFAAIMDLKALPWFPASVRDIRAFRVEQWSDFTAIVKGP